MNNAIIFIKNDEEKRLAQTIVNGKTVYARTVKQIKKLGISNIYLIGEIDDACGVKKAKDIVEVIKEIEGTEGKTLLTTPLYPLLRAKDYGALFVEEEGGSVFVGDNEVCNVFVVPNNKLADFESISYKPVTVEEEGVLAKIADPTDSIKYEYLLRKKYLEDESPNEPLDSRLSDIKVFALTGNEDLVREICGYLNIDPGKVSVKHFADGETLVEPGESLRGKKVFIVQSTYKPVNERLMELLVCIDAMKRASAGEITCIIPYYGYARQDRKASPRQPITSKLVATILEAAGASRVVTIDIHAAQIQGFFNIPMDNLTTIPMVGQYFLNTIDNLEDFVVVSPDHGGATRARKLAQILDTPLAIVDKRRPRPNECEATNIIGDIEGKNVIVVDDICDTAGSLTASCGILKERGAKDIYCAVAHPVFSGPALDRIENSPIKEFVVTNTIPLDPSVKEKTNKIKVLSIGWMLSKLIEAVATNSPVSEVYDLFKRK